MVKTLASSELNCQQEIQASLKRMSQLMSQMTTDVYQLIAQDSGTLPSQPEINPQNVSVVTLQSENQLEEIPILKKSEEDEEQVVSEVERYHEVPND
ncbi:hypothetical protein ACS0TY_036119 [Phlomoides rotata]